MLFFSFFMPNLWYSSNNNSKRTASHLLAHPWFRWEGEISLCAWKDVPLFRSCEVRSLRSSTRTKCRPSAPRTAPPPTAQDRRLTAPWRLHWRLHCPHPLRHNHRRAPALRLPLISTKPRPTTVERQEGKNTYTNVAFSGVKSRHRLRPKPQTRLRWEGSSRAITRRITVLLPLTATVTAVFSPSVAASRSAARVDGSQLHMRRDPARSPIDRQRIASLQFPGFGARWARFGTSISLRTNKTRHRHERTCEPWRVSAWVSLFRE